MPGKARIPAPIDRPLSRAYLREFTGWSSAYPPGISDPTSLRVMENVMVNRDGSARLRPGLRYLSREVYDVAQPAGAITQEVIGTHEPFFLNDGRKAYLFAVREDDLSVGFRVLLEEVGVGQVTVELTHPAVDFTIAQGYAAICFSSATTYVKYLQIDNKIFALSNAGETMRLFTVGATKTAKALNSIERPDWNVADKLTVVHPDAGWISGSTPSSVRTNRVLNPNMDVITAWKVSASTPEGRATQSSTLAANGTKSLRLESAPARTNMAPAPLHDVASTGVTGWYASTNAASISAVGSRLRVNGDSPAGVGGTYNFYTRPVTLAVSAGKSYRTVLDWVADSGVSAALVRYRWENAAGDLISFTDKAITPTAGRRSSGNVTAPAGATRMIVYVGGTSNIGTNGWFEFNNVLIQPSEDTNTAFFHGGSGANYFWTGAVNASYSVYHPPADVAVYTDVDPLTVTNWAASAQVRAGSTGRNVNVDIQWLGGAGGTTSLGLTVGAVAPDTNAWVWRTTTALAPDGTTKGRLWVKVAAVPRGEYHYVDTAVFEQGTGFTSYFDGNDPDGPTKKYDWLGTANNSASTESTYSAGASLPPAETKTANTLISSTSSANQYNFGFFYTFNNEIGESAASQVTVVRAQRSWAAWRWETPNGAGEPSGTATTDPTLACDQLVAYVPQAVFEAAGDQGATHLNLYAFTWSDQDPVPVTAVRVHQREVRDGMSYAANAWLRMSPQMADAGAEAMPLPKVSSRYNYSNPSRGGQGIVASDRMVMVNDPVAQAVIRWSSNQQGNYTDFSASRGGGYKTLTSGNLYVPACVKLWQNPQSVDTLTILCMGVDGMSTGYYMAPAQVASQSEAVNVMGFEETTATPGTTSPYGCEVLNNALYHPLDEMLMKSTANNYNISHKSVTDQIQDRWRLLGTKNRIVSSQHDNRLYLLVNNPAGEPLEENCWGNEVWVFDAASEGGSWSRWLTQGKSLRKIEQDGQVVMSLIRPDGIYYFDERYSSDDYVDDSGPNKVIASRSIPWKLETNTQGANRAHDAWARLQQCNIVLGFFQGVIRYGIRGYDLNGMRVEISKLTRDGSPVSDLAYDLEDYLKIGRDLKEWFFFAESVTDDAGVVQPSAGQINLVQYRYTPSSVNTGYEYGSIETFEYGRAGNALDARTTDNGVPIPYVDTGRP